MSDETNSQDNDSEPTKPMTIEERLAYLEEQNEGLKTVGKLLLALSVITAGLLAWTQMNQRSSIFSESIVLETGGRAKAALTSNTGNHLALLSFDQMGILPTDPQFGAVGDLNGLVLYDKMGKPRVVLGVTGRDETVFDLFSADGKRIFSAVPVAAPAGGAPSPNGAATPAPTGAATPAPAPAQPTP